MKNKVIMITGEDLIDVDMPIVKEIHKYYDFLWVVILRGYGWFSEESIMLFCENNKIKYKIIVKKLKIKDPRGIIFHLKLLKFLDSVKADLIYDSYLGTPHFHFFLPLFLDERKLVIAIHDVVQHHNMGYRKIRSLYYSFLMNRYNNIHLFSTNQMQLFLSNYTQHKKNILLAPLCLKDFGYSSNISKENKNVNFIFFGILRENKGVDILIKAVNILSKKHKNFSVTIAGKASGSYWETCKTLIEDDSFYNFNIRTIEKEEVANLFQAAQFLILPYLDVTQSGVLLTSYNYNIPAIASKLPGFEEYIEDEKTGFLFDVADVCSLINKMEKALSMNAAEYDDMKKQLEYFVKHEISASAIGEKYTHYFNNLLKINSFCI